MVLFLPISLTAQCFLGQSFLGVFFGHLSVGKLVIGIQKTLLAVTSEDYMVIRFSWLSLSYLEMASTTWFESFLSLQGKYGMCSQNEVIILFKLFKITRALNN